jgi:hypothetical protein
LHRDCTFHHQTGCLAQVPLIPPLVSIHTLALGVICILSRLCMVCSYVLLGARALVAFVAVILLSSLVVALGEFVLRAGALFDDSCVVVLSFPYGSALIAFYFPSGKCSSGVLVLLWARKL